MTIAPSSAPRRPPRRADVGAMHASNRAAWDEAAERYERLAAGGDRADPGRRHEPAAAGARGDRRPARPLPARDPPPVRGRPRHAVAVESRRRRGRRCRLQPADAGPRAAAVGGGRRPGDAGSRPTSSTRRRRSTERPISSTPAAGRSSGSRISTRGPPSSSRLLAPDGRFVLFEGHPIEWLFDVDADGSWVATDYDYFAGPEASKGWAPEYIDHLSIPEPDQAWKFARSWTLGEVLTALARAGLRFERIAEHPTDWWGGHADVRPEERGRIPLSYSVVAHRA